MGGPRFGTWAPVRGTLAALDHPGEPLDASWAHDRGAVLAAERAGFDAVLVAEHAMNPLGDELGQLEAWTATAALAGLTERIELIVAGSAWRASSSRARPARRRTPS